MVCRQQMGTWEHVLPLFVPGYTVLFPTCSDNVLNVPLCGYTCTRILYPVTNSVPTYLRLERPRRRGRSKRPGTLFVTGYNMRVHTANCYPTFPTFDAPNKSRRFFLFPRGYMRVPVYPTYPVAKGHFWPAQKCCTIWALYRINRPSRPLREKSVELLRTTRLHASDHVSSVASYLSFPFTSSKVGFPTSTRLQPADATCVIADNHHRKISLISALMVLMKSYKFWC